MKQSKPDQVHSMLRRLDRSYPYFPSTFSICPNEGCTGSGRGEDVCANCIEKELINLLIKLAPDSNTVDIIGEVKTYHSILIQKSNRYSELVNLVRANK